ncbi:hypothetical protein R1sor_001214 [Riccia sorocarpa]|uniref:Ribosomal protein S14 n=1 Tax=Riccia sorocarpa TaxID=122646 RepID=A0ABD3GVB6_9MARC
MKTRSAKYRRRNLSFYASIDDALTLLEHKRNNIGILTRLETKSKLSSRTQQRTWATPGAAMWMYRPQQPMAGWIHVLADGFNSHCWDTLSPSSIFPVLPFGTMDRDRPERCGNVREGSDTGSHSLTW